MSTKRPSGYSPLQLESLAFTDVRITAQIDAKEGGKSTTDVGFGGAPLDETHRRWQVTIQVTLGQTGEVKPFYLGAVHCVGIFFVVEEYPPEKIERLVMVNGTGMLYGAVREMISNITSRGPWPMVNLVSQSFIEGFERGKLKEASQASAKTITSG
jgi:preprotein translocase subunit SecB